MDYSPLSEKDITLMLKSIGVTKIEDLFLDIPLEIRNPEMALNNGLSELETYQYMKNLSKENQVFDNFFCGAGSYHHFIPPVVNEIVRRGEFYTSYTPYQAEISQGFLQAIFEYQTAISNLTGMDASNASIYDGATALTESIIMAVNITGKRKILVLQPINPDYIEVLETYAFSSDFSLSYISITELNTNENVNEYAAVVIQNPNYFGEIFDLSSIITLLKEKSSGILIINLIIESTSLGILKRPGNIGVDIVCGEGQPIGLPLNFGGPGMGFITTKKKFMRKLPGRIVGKTKELKGDKEGFVLTLQAREQHIRREKALSNICTNEALCMLSVLVHLVSLGYSGLRNLAEINAKQGYFMKNAIHKMSKFEIFNYGRPIYNEFLVEGPRGSYDQIAENCILNNVCPPYSLTEKNKELLIKGTDYKFDESKDFFLVCTTEMNSKKVIEKFLGILEYISNKTGGK